MLPVLIVDNNKKTVFKMVPLLPTLVFIKPFYQFSFMGLGIFKTFLELLRKNRCFMIKGYSNEIKILFLVEYICNGLNFAVFRKNPLHAFCAPEIIPSD